MNNPAPPATTSLFDIPTTQSNAVDRAIDALTESHVRHGLSPEQAQRLHELVRCLPHPAGQSPGRQDNQSPGRQDNPAGQNIPGHPAGPGDRTGRYQQRISIDADFDLAAELGNQLVLLRAMQATLLDEQGALTPGTSIREVRESLTAANTLYGTLLKSQEKLLSQSRMQAVVRTAAEVLRELDPQAHDRYFELLEKRLDQLT